MPRRDRQVALVELKTAARVQDFMPFWYSRSLAHRPCTWFLAILAGCLVLSALVVPLGTQIRIDTEMDGFENRDHYASKREAGRRGASARILDSDYELPAVASARDASALDAGQVPPATYTVPGWFVSLIYVHDESGGNLLTAATLQAIHEFEVRAYHSHVFQRRGWRDVHTRANTNGHDGSLMTPTPFSSAMQYLYPSYLNASESWRRASEHGCCNSDQRGVCPWHYQGNDTSLASLEDCPSPGAALCCPKCPHCADCLRCPLVPLRGKDGAADGTSILFDGLGRSDTGASYRVGQEGVQRALRYIVRGDRPGDAQWFFGKDFDKLSLRTSSLRTEVAFGSPLPGFAWYRSAGQEEVVRGDVLDFVRGLERDFNVPGVRLVCGGDIVTEAQLIESLKDDTFLAASSLIVVFVYMVCYLHSVVLGLLAVLQVLLTIPVSLFWYAVVFREGYLGALNVLSLYVMLGIAVDDIFVFSNAFFYSEKPEQLFTTDGDVPLEQRLAYALRKSGVPMLVTTTTSATAFFANLVSSIPAVRAFGALMGVLVIMNYVLVMTLFPAILAMYFKYTPCRRAGRGRAYAAGSAAEQEPTKHLRVSGWGVGGCPVYTQPSFDSPEAGCLCDGDAVTVTVHGRCAGTAAALHRVVEGGPPGYVTLRPRATVTHTLPFSARVFLERPVSTPLTAPVISYLCTDAPHERPACLPKVPIGMLPAGATVELYADEFDYWTSSGFHKLCGQSGYVFLEEKVRPNVPFQRRYVLEGWGGLGCPAFVEPHLGSKVAEFLPNGSVVVEATDYLRAGTAPRSPTDPMVDCFLKVRRDGERQTYCVTSACAAPASAHFERSPADACEKPNILKQPAAEKPADNHEDGAAVTAAPSTLLQEVEWGQLRCDRRSDDGGQRAAVFEVVGWGEEGCPEYTARSTDSAVVRRHCDGDVVPCALEEGHDLRTCAFLLTSQGGHIQVRSTIGAGGLVQRLSLVPAAARRRSACKPPAQPPRYRSQRSLARCSFRQPTPIQLLAVSTFGAPVYAEPNANARVTSCVHSGDTVEVVCSADDKSFLRVTSGGFVKKDPDLQFRRVERDARAKQPFGNPLDGFASSAASPSDASAEVLDAAAGLLLPRLAKRHMVMNLSAADNACGLPLHPQLIYNEMQKRGLRGGGCLDEEPDMDFFAIDFDDAEHSGRDLLERVFNGDVVHITDAFVDARKEGLGPERVHRCVKVQYRGVSGEEDEATRYVPVGNLTPAEFPACLSERFLPVFLLTGATPDAGIPVFSDPHFVHSTIVHVLHRRDVLVAEPNNHGTDTFVRVMLPLQGRRAGYVYCEDLRQEGVGLLGGRRRSSAPSMAEAAQHVKVPRGADPGCVEYARASEGSKVVRVHPPNAVIEVASFPKAKVGGGGNADHQFVKTTAGGFVRADRVVRLPRLPRTLSELRRDTYPAYEVTAWGDRGCPVYKSPRSGSTTTEVLFDGERVEALGTANGFVGLRQGGYARLKEQAHGAGGARSGRLKPVASEGCQAQTKEAIEEGWDDFMSQSLSQAIIRCTSDIMVEVPSDEEEGHAGYETDSEAASDLSNPAQATDKTEGTDSTTSVLAPHLNGDNFRLGSEPIPQGDGPADESDGDDGCRMPGYSEPWLRRVFDSHVFPAVYAQRFVLLAVFTFVTVAFVMAVSRLTHQEAPPSFFRSDHPVYIYRNKNAIFSTAGTCAQKFGAGCGALFHERAPRVVGCDGVVYSGAEVDACGVCQGSGSTCPGCDGVLGSNKVANACGMCGLPASACPPPGTASGDTPGPAATMPPPVAASVVPVRVSLRVTCGEHAFKRGFDNVKRLKLVLIYDLRATMGSRDIESVAVDELTVADDGCAHAAARSSSVLSATGQYLIQVRFQLYSHILYSRSLLEDTVQGQPFTASARYLEEHGFGTVSEVLLVRQPTAVPESPQPPPQTAAPANATDQPPPGTLQPASETPDETLAPPRDSDVPATAPPDTEAPLVDTAVPLTEVPPTSTPATAVPVTDAPTTAVPLEADTSSPEPGMPTLSPSTSLPHTPVPETEAPMTTLPDTLIPTTLPLTSAPLTGSPTEAPTMPTSSDAPSTSVPTLVPTAPRVDDATGAPESELPTALVPAPANLTASPAGPTARPTTDAPATHAPNEDTDLPSTPASPTSLPATQSPVSVAPPPTDPPVVTTGVPDTSAPPADTTIVPAVETAKPVWTPEPSRAPTDAPAQPTAAPTATPVANLPIATANPLTEVPPTGTPATDVPATDAPMSAAPLEPDTVSPETGMPTLSPSTPLPHTPVPQSEAPVTTSPLPHTSAPSPPDDSPLPSSSPVTVPPPTASTVSTQPATDAPMTPFPETPSDTDVPTPAPTDAPHVDDATPEPPPVSSGALTTETPATAQPSASTGVPEPLSGSGAPTTAPTAVPKPHSKGPPGTTVLTAVLRLTANCYVYKALSEEAKAQVHEVLIADVESSLMRTDGVEAVVKVESVTCGSLVISLSMTGEGLLRDSVFRSLPAAAFFSRAEILTTLQTAVLAILRVDVYDGVVRVTEEPSPREPELACRDAAFFRSACGQEKEAGHVIKGYEQGCQDVAPWMVQCTGNTTCNRDTGRCVCDGYLTGPSCAECSDACVNTGGSCDASGSCVMCNGESRARLEPLTYWVDSCGTCGPPWPVGRHIQTAVPNAACTGCDGILSSGVYTDSCGVCGGTNDCKIKAVTDTTTVEVSFLFGVDEDRSHKDGEEFIVAYDYAFDPSTVGCQKHLRRICDVVYQRAWTRMQVDEAAGANCMFTRVDDYLHRTWDLHRHGKLAELQAGSRPYLDACLDPDTNTSGVCTGGLPVVPSGFVPALQDFLHEEGGLTYFLQTGWATKGWVERESRLKYFKLLFRTNRDGLSSGYAIVDEFHFWEDLMDDINEMLEGTEDAARCRGYQTADEYPEAFVQIAAVNGLIYSVVISLAAAFMAVLAFTCSLVMTVLVLVTMGVVIVATFAVFSIAGWQVGPVEAVALSVVIGLSVDYSLHLAECYIEVSSFVKKNKLPFSRYAVVKKALVLMAQPLTHAAATTVLSSIPLLFCTFKPLAQFGLVMVISITLSLFFSLLLFTPMLMVVGPRPHTKRLRTRIAAILVTPTIIVLVVLIVAASGIAVKKPNGEPLL